MGHRHEADYRIRSAGLGAVYKLVAIEEDGKLTDTIKISSNPEKVTTPGRKRVYRIINKLNHHSEGDYIALYDERVNDQKRLKMFHPVHTFVSKFVTDFYAKDLHEPIFENGVLCYDNPEITDIQQYVQDNLKLLWEEYKRISKPEEYPVDLSEDCWSNKMQRIHEIKSELKRELE